MTGLGLLVLWISSTGGVTVSADTAGPVAVALQFARTEMGVEYEGKAAELQIDVADYLIGARRSRLEAQVPMPRSAREAVVSCQRPEDVEPPAMPMCSFDGANGHVTITVRELKDDRAVITVSVLVPTERPHTRGLEGQYVTMELQRTAAGWHVGRILARGAT